MRLPFLAATLFACLSAGCLTQVGAPPASQDAPRWTVGDTWSYDLRERGTPAGNETFRVVGEGEVLGEAAYRVEVVTHRPGNPPAERFEFYDKDTLNRVRDTCAQPGSMPPCSARIRELDFPLTDGKTWPSPTTGDDVVVERTATAEALGGTRWRIDIRSSICPTCLVELHFDSAVGFLTERRGYYEGEMLEQAILTSAR